MRRRRRRRPPRRGRRRAGSRGEACGSLLLHADELDLEDERRVRGDLVAHGARAVAEVRRDHELALAAFLHPGDALVPALDDAALAELEREALVAVLSRGVELAPVRERADVLHRDRVARLGL